jgi:hypothetical protein
MEYRYLGFIFSGALTGVTIGDYPRSEKGVRLAQKIQVGPCIPREYSDKRLKFAQLLGQLGVSLARYGYEYRCNATLSVPSAFAPCDDPGLGAPACLVGTLADPSSEHHAPGAWAVVAVLPPPPPR